MGEKDFKDTDEQLTYVGVVNTLVGVVDPDKESLIKHNSPIDPFLQSVVESVSREIDVSVSIPTPVDYTSYLTNVYHNEERRYIRFSKRLIIIESSDFNIILLGLFGDDRVNKYPNFLHPRNFRILLFSGKNEGDQKDSVFKINYRSNGLEMEELTVDTQTLMLKEMQKASLQLSRKTTLKERFSRKVGSLFEIYGKNHIAGPHGNRWG